MMLDTITSTNVTFEPDGGALFAQVASYLPLEDREHVHAAFELARREHGDERRKSGELFFTHPLTVATYLSEYYVDAPALIAALLHDVAEDTSVSVREIEVQFGQEVGRIVDGLTKFDRVTAKAKLGRELSVDEVKHATLYKLFEMMTADVRVGIVKIFDRLHNMRTIKAMPPHKQKEKARETLSVYAPLANRLGMWRIKNELQALSLEVLTPNQYKNLTLKIREREARHSRVFNQLKESIYDALKVANVKVVDVVPAPEDIYHLYSKLSKVDRSERQILDDPPKLVVLLTDETACYIALGIVHSLWRPVQGEFDDYIAAPRENLYRSLHTTVIYKGRPVKVRLRTINMQIESQSGVLSQWLHNTNMPVWSNAASQRVDAMIDTIRENVKIEESEITESVRRVIDDVFKNQIIVYTPTGEMRELPQGATAVDFAYTIHTAVGHSCRAALINDEQKPLTYTLQDGDSVSIQRHGSEPQRVWLDEDLGYLQTTSAKAAVRRWFRRLPYDHAITEGEALLEHELSTLSHPEYAPTLIASWFGYETAEELYHALGRAELPPANVATRILAELWKSSPHEVQTTNTIIDITGEKIAIENAGQRPLRLCGTCNPHPGQQIVGFIRRDGYVTVHSTSCRTLSPDAMRGGRSLMLRWGDRNSSQKRPVALQITVHDRDGLLNEITELMRDEQINITLICSRSIKFTATIILGVEMTAPRQIVRFLHRVQALDNVISVSYLGEAPLEWSTDSGIHNSTCPFDLIEEALCQITNNNPPTNSPFSRSTGK